MDITSDIENLGIVPVVAIEDVMNAPALAEALLAGGVPCAEITFRTSAAEGSIKKITKQYPEMLVGAGTVLTISQADQAAEAGARFVVTPGFDGEVIDWCVENNMPVMPGVATPTEINMALNKGLHVLKFFPAEAMGGVNMLKAISGPYQRVKFLPTGGINPENFADYLGLHQVIACGGSWLVKKQMISAGEFDRIAILAKEARQIVDTVRKN